MYLISIEIISRGESSLESVLESINKQSYKDFEIVCADASSDKQVKQLLLSYGCRVIEIPEKCGHLEARYIAHINSKGSTSLILDSTRPLKENALELLFRKYYFSDMVIIKEDSLGKGFWVNQAKLIKEISESQIKRTEKENIAFLLPRFYNSKILTQAFNNIFKNTGPLFEKISYGEHHLIFEECKKFSSKIVLTEETLLSHYEDDSLLKIVRKYYRYGKMQKLLKELPSSAVSKLQSHRRKGISLRLRVRSIPISFARGIPFILAYIF